MRTRCQNKNSKSYKDYGGRGISVSKEWESFEQFYKDMGDPPEKMSLDRIDNDKGYCKENCHWATRLIQMNNKQSSVRISFNGRTQTASQWGREFGIDPDTIYFRIKAGWPIDKLFVAPKRSKL